MTRLLIGDTQSSRSKICFKNEAAEPEIEGNTAHRDAAGLGVRQNIHPSSHVCG